MLSFWELEMKKSDKSLEARHETASKLSKDLLQTFRGSQSYLKDLDAKLNEEAELYFVTELLSLLRSPIRDSDTCSKETKAES